MQEKEQLVVSIEEETATEDFSVYHELVTSIEEETDD